MMLNFQNSNHNRNYIRNNSKKILLTVPVNYKSKTKIKDIQIDNSRNWKKALEFNKQSYGS